MPLPVWLYAPNIVGYLRIFLAALACWYMSTDPYVTATLYVISCLLDAVDGYLARRLQQCTKFGAVLDMITDRSTTTCLLMYLGWRYPRYLMVLQALVSLDFSSHYVQMFASLTAGSESHKQTLRTDSWLLRLYYGNRFVLFSLCAANELFWLLVYLISFNVRWLPVNADWDALRISLYVVGPFCLLKHWMNLIQFWTASRRLLAHDLAVQQQQRTHTKRQ